MIIAPRNKKKFYFTGFVYSEGILMKISAVNQSFLNIPVFNGNKRSSLHYAYNLDRDTVSFGHARAIKDRLEVQHRAKIPQYILEKNMYMAALKTVADDLSEYGVSFVRENSDPYSIKDTDRVIEKIETSKSFDIRDQIRATMYMKDPYDVDFVLEKFLPKMKENGYELAKKDGEFDIDFRLNSDDLSGANPSGYEDIQMRFVKIGESKKKKTCHELIILFGPIYHEAKNLEHDLVFEHTRQFKKLHVYDTTAKIGTPESKIKRAIEDIIEIYNTQVSKPLYSNAKDKEYYHREKEEKSIFFTNENVRSIKNDFYELYENIEIHYRNERRKNRGNQSVIDQLNAAQEYDIEKLDKICAGLLKTLNSFPIIDEKDEKDKKDKKENH